MKYACQNCEWFTDSLDALHAIDRIYERVAPGEEMPAGQCPLCGCLVHEENDTHEELGPPPVAPTPREVPASVIFSGPHGDNCTLAAIRYNSRADALRDAVRVCIDGDWFDADSYDDSIPEETTLYVSNEHTELAGIAVTDFDTVSVILVHAAATYPKD